MKPENSLARLLASKGACFSAVRYYRGLGLEEAWKKLKRRQEDKRWLVQHVLGIEHSIHGKCWCGNEQSDGKPRWPRNMKQHVFAAIRKWQLQA
jgi:hypothetical protein